MTRINLIPPRSLSTKHLVAEYREITRLPNNLKKSLNRKSTPFSFDEIPKQYVLGKGHVKFFYNKMYFLKKRFEKIVHEMLRRGYNPSFRDSSIFNSEKIYFKNYKPSAKSIRLNKERIQARTKD